MKDLTLLDLLQAGAHFGHKTSRWHPKMKQYLYGTRGGIHILDLQKTREGLEKAAKAVGDIAAVGGTVLFVGTKRQARGLVQAAAERCGMPYVTVRWLGGTFTNFRTIQLTIKQLEKLKEEQASEDFGMRRTKKERLVLQRQIEKMSRLLGGIQTLRKLPDAIFVASVHHDSIAVREARKSRIKVVGVTDSNTDTANIDVVIPANDDAVSAIDLIANYLADAILEGKNRYGTEPAQASNMNGDNNVIAVDVSDAKEDVVK